MNYQNVEWQANGKVEMPELKNVNWAMVSIGVFILVAVIILANEK